MDVEKTVKEFKAGKVEYRTDKTGNILVPVGKASFGAQQLKENIQAIYSQLMRIKPSTVKGVYMLNISVSATMGPGIKIDGSTIA
jgi:large subunit ribosomal protein L1